MKKIIAILLTLCVLLGLTACGKSADSKSEKAQSVSSRTLNFTINSADSGSFGKACHMFMDKVSEYTDGRITIQFYPGDQIANGSSTTSFEMLQQGTCDFVWGSGLILSNFDERMGITALPWIFNSAEEALSAMKGEPGQAMRNIAESCGIKVLGIGDNGFRDWTGTSKIFKSPDDFKGVKYRVPTVPIFIDLFTKLGADPVAINMSELYIALQQGAVEGQENPVEMCMNWNMFEVQKYLTVSHYCYDPFYFCVSPSTWDSLSDADKEAIQKAVDEITEFQIEERARTDAENLERAKNEFGVEVYVLSDEELAVFKDVAAPIYDKYVASYSDLLQLFGYTV